MDGFFGSAGGRGFFGSMGDDIDNVFIAFQNDFFKAFEDNMRNINAVIQAELPAELLDIIAQQAPPSGEQPSLRTRMIQGAPVFPAQGSGKARTLRESMLVGDDDMALSHVHYAHMDMPPTPAAPSPWSTLWGGMLGNDENGPQDAPGNMPVHYSKRYVTTSVNGVTATETTTSTRNPQGETEVTTVRQEGNETHTRIVRTLADGTQTTEEYKGPLPSAAPSNMPVITEITLDHTTPKRGGWLSWLWGK